MEKTFLQKFLSIFSRTNYTISPESFKEQFAAVTPESLQAISIRNPMSNFDNPATRVKYKAKNTQRITLDNSPALETKITLTTGKRHVFYFDTMFVENGFLVGEKSRIFHLYGKVPMDSIAKIEIQNGGKRYKYDK